jgi:muconate cycloisomerase
MRKPSRICRVNLHQVVVPAKPGSINSECFGVDIDWDLWPICLVELHTDDGRVGLGEATRGVELAALEPFSRQLVGVAVTPSLACLPPSFRIGWDFNLVHRHPEPMWKARQQAHQAALMAIEIALLDLAGKRMGCRVADLLGGPYRESVPVDYWCARQTPDDLSRLVRRARELGFRGLKMKSKLEPGHGRSADLVLEQVAAITQAAGQDFRITIDPMFQWCSPTDALPIFRELEKITSHVQVEDPFPQDQPEYWRRARQVSSIPLIWHARTLEVLRRALQEQCADDYNCAGPISEFMTQAHAVEAHGGACWHGSGIELGVGQVAHLHAACAARACVLASDFVSGLIRQHTLIDWNWPYRDGQLPLPQGPGLGVKLDLEAVEKHKTGQATIA